MNEGDPDIDAGELAEEFVEGLLGQFGAKFELERRDLDDDTVEIAVTGDDLGVLIGPRGQTLAAVQELARTVVQRRAPGVRTRVLVDIAGYRMARREALERFTRGVAARWWHRAWPGCSSPCRPPTARSCTTRPTPSTACRPRPRARSPAGGS